MPASNAPAFDNDTIIVGEYLKCITVSLRLQLRPTHRLSFFFPVRVWIATHSPRRFG